nr:reverse transcriptase domain-containing protein [Tanacetum cinerariifolium]
GVIIPLFDTMMVQATADMGDTPVETQQTPIVDQPSTSKPQRKQKPPRKQRKEAKVSHDESQDEEHVPTPSSDPLPSGEDSFTLNEFMVFCTNLQEQIGLGRRMKSPMEKDSLGAQEDASKQGRIIKEINKNVEISLDDETQGRTNDDDMFGVDDLADEEVVMDTRTVTTTVKVSVAPTIDVTEDEITMAQALARLKSAKLKIVVQEQKKSTTIPTAAKTVTTTVTTPRAKDKNVKPVIDDTEELKKCMEIVPDDEDEMLIEATPLSSKSPTIIDYKIHKEDKELKILFIGILKDDESDDPEDRLNFFQAAAKVERWGMLTWCHISNSTLTGSARVWFDDIPPKSIDSYDDFKKAFLANYLQQKNCIKDPVEIHHIKQREREFTVLQGRSGSFQSSTEESTSGIEATGSREKTKFLHASEGDRRAVRTHMRILSVVRIDVFSMYGYDYIKKIVLHRADLNEHVIKEHDFKYLYPSDFEDLYLLNHQDNALKTSSLRLKATRLSLTSPNLDRMPRALNTSTTTCDGTLHQIDEAMDYCVKEFKVNRMNPGLNTRFWTRKDVDR